MKIDQDYFKNNIIDDGSYTLVGSESIYTKTIPANLLSFSMDDDCKLHIKFKYQKAWLYSSDIILTHTIATTGGDTTIGGVSIRYFSIIF